MTIGSQIGTVYDIAADAQIPAENNIHAWYDFSDKSTLFQNIAGTTAVAANGDIIRRINDKSGNDRNIVCTSDTISPIIWRTSGFRTINSKPVGEAVAEYADFGNVGSTVSGLTDCTRLILYRLCDSTSITGQWIHPMANMGGYNCRYPQSDSGEMYDTFGLTSTSLIRTLTGDMYDNRIIFELAEIDTSNTTTRFYPLFKITGTADFTTSVNQSTTRWNTGTNFVGSYPATRPKWTIAEIIYWNKILSSTEKNDLITYMAEKWNVTVS